MRLNTRYTFLLWALLVPVITLWADDYPTVNPIVTFTNSEGETSTDLAYTGSAPVKASCVANPENTTGWDGYYEWRIYHDTEETPYIIRYEQDTELEFTQSGTHRIVLYAKFTKDGEVQEFLTDDSPVTVTISESQLQMPNAFSPNGDGINDIYKAKSGYQSLIEFHGYIFNRWGQNFSNGATLPTVGMAPTRASRLKMESTSALSRQKEPMEKNTISSVMSTC